MKGFIVATFAFLGLSFYHLSDGAKFEPRGTRAESAAHAAALAGATETVAETAAPRPQVIAPRQAPGQTAQTAAAASAETQTETASVAELTEPAAQIGNGLTLISGTQPLAGFQLASLEQGLQQATTTTDAQPAVATDAEPVTDLRKIKGSRVNIRQGPGTNYPIIARLTNGNEVEILSDPGNGWLRLRTPEDKRIGWISASLVTRGN